MTPDVVRRFRVPLILTFFLSGFCGLLYQVVWVRLAFAAFGVITPVLSVVISVFMLGLAVGSWAAGKRVTGWTRRTGWSAVYFYAICELGIGVGAFLVPRLFDAGQRLLLPIGGMDSGSYLLVSAGVLAASILPWCVLMGATFPLMMLFVKEVDRWQNSSFSYLYTANVAGAAVGTAVTAIVLIEVLGFVATLAVAATLNLVISMIAFAMGRRHPNREGIGLLDDMRTTIPPSSENTSLTPAHMWGVATILFLTGFSALALEVVWTRAFTPVLRTTVYSFALLLFTYLVATYLGSWLYRRHLSRSFVARTPTLLAALALVSPLPVLMNDPRVSSAGIVILISIFPFCFLLGYLTPKLIDRWSRGFPASAGRAYAINVIGCILGPLVASYAILPAIGVRYAMVLLATPFVLLTAWSWRRAVHRSRWQLGLAGVSLVLLLLATTVSVSFEEGTVLAEGAEVRRDHTATVISYGEGIGRDGQRLLVNGIGITHKNPITKIMSHMPLAFHGGDPNSALVICFGMGTTFRSLMSWGIDTTAVELVPSVRDAFPFYFDDAQKLMSDLRGEIIIDDGRRYLQRTNKSFDVITIDPPPPVQAAGSSLLYSSEFYRLLKKRLNHGGVVQQWYPGAAFFHDRTLEQATDPDVVGRTPLSAVLRSVLEEFEYVRLYPSFQGWGWHILASEQPFDEPTVEEFIAQMPPAARNDMLEWNTGPNTEIERFVSTILETDISVDRVLGNDPDVRIKDDRPYNEYFLVRGP